MPLPQVESKTPTAIADISIELGDYLNPPLQEGRYSVQVLDEDGLIMRVATGDILPHLSGADKTWLSDFLDRMRAKAEQEMLP